MSDLNGTSLAAWFGAATGAAALAITWWKLVRDSRAELPVGWTISPEERKAPVEARHPFNYVAKVTCNFADAHNFNMEVYHPGAIGMPSGLQYTSSVPRLAVGDSEEIALMNGVSPGTAWVRLYWCHPKDVRRPVVAWFPLIPRHWNGMDTPAADEHFRQATQPMVWQWVRAVAVQSRVGPGNGILGRTTGWRDRRAGRRTLRRDGVKPWSAVAESAPRPEQNVYFPDEP